MCILSRTQSILLVVLYTLAGGITMELESIGRNIRKFRLMRNLRQEDLAEMAGLSINYVGALERGEKIPSLEPPKQIPLIIRYLSIFKSSIVL